MDLSIVLPAYQESENLKKLIPQLKTVLGSLNLSAEIIVVDTATKMDDTDITCESLGAVYINRKNGNTYGAAIRTGIDQAVGKKLIIMDADGSHSPLYIKDLYYNSQEYDIVVGSRYIKGGQTENNFILIFMSLIVNIAYRVLLNIKIKDVSNSFRLYDTAKLKRIKTECENFDLVEEILMKLMLENYNLKIKEIPIVFKKRDLGKSKRSLVKFMFSYLDTINRLIKIKREHNKKSLGKKLLPAEMNKGKKELL